MNTEFFTHINIFLVGKTNIKTKLSSFYLGQNSKENAEIQAQKAFFDNAKFYFKYNVFKDEIIEKINAGQITIDEALKDKNNFNPNTISRVDNPLNKWGDDVLTLGNITFKDNDKTIFYELEYEEITH
jgi:hypothetical protein